MTRADLHRLTGVSKPGITQAVESGRLNVDEHGQIDPDDPLTIAYINEPRRQRAMHGSKLAKKIEVVKEAKTKAMPRPRGPKPKPIAAGPVFTPPSPTSKTQQPKASWKNQPSGEGESYNEAEKRKMIAAADGQELKNKKALGELVERADVQSVFFQLQAVDSKQILPIGQRTAAEIAAVFGVDDSTKVLQAQELIDIETKRALAQSKKLMDDWLVAHEVNS